MKTVIHYFVRRASAFRFAKRSARYWNEIGRSYAHNRQFERALDSYDRALKMDSQNAKIMTNRANVLIRLGRFDEAEKVLRIAIFLASDHANAYHSLALVLIKNDRLIEADACLRTALSLQPNFSSARHNLSYVSYRLGRTEGAITNYREALRLDPDNAELHTGLAHALLLAGHFQEGWQEFEWRLKTGALRHIARHYRQPSWNGATVGDGVLLLHAEHGYGDTIQFCRFVPDISRQTKVVLRVQRPLVRLVSRLEGNATVISVDDAIPYYDAHCPLMSIPRALGITLESVPSRVPYLHGSPLDVQRFRARIDALPGLKVGICWAGGQSLHNPEQVATDARRSMSPELLAPLFEIPNISFVSLQVGDGLPKSAQQFNLEDFTSELHDFADTAALIETLDLIISVDTAVAHLAGALAKPIWLLNRFDTCFRWLQRRHDSPWYPSLRQFRQPISGDWESVVSAVQGKLRAIVCE